MQPTIDAELSGARRMLEPLAADPTVSAETAVQLATVIAMLKRLERSWSRVLPHLVSDNIRIAETLREVASSLPPDLRAAIDRTLPEQHPLPEAHSLDVGAANRTNEELRELLGKAITATSSEQGDAADTVRARALASLREGLETRPW